MLFRSGSSSREDVVCPKEKVSLTFNYKSRVGKYFRWRISDLPFKSFLYNLSRGKLRQDMERPKIASTASLADSNEIEVVRSGLTIGSDLEDCDRRIAEIQASLQKSQREQSNTVLKQQEVDEQVELVIEEMCRLRAVRKGLIEKRASLHLQQLSLKATLARAKEEQADIWRFMAKQAEDSAPVLVVEMEKMPSNIGKNVGEGSPTKRKRTPKKL